MTLAAVRRPTCEARSAARKASPITYTPPWKYRTTWRGSIPPTVISAAGTPPSAARVTVPAGWHRVGHGRGLDRRHVAELRTGSARCRAGNGRHLRPAGHDGDARGSALAGAASGVLNTGRQLGGTLGGAVTGAVLASQ